MAVLDQHEIETAEGELKRLEHQLEVGEKPERAVTCALPPCRLAALSSAILKLVAILTFVHRPARWMSCASPSGAWSGTTTTPGLPSKAARRSTLRVGDGISKQLCSGRCCSCPSFSATVPAPAHCLTVTPHVTDDLKGMLSRYAAFALLRAVPPSSVRPRPP